MFVTFKTLHTTLILSILKQLRVFIEFITDNLVAPPKSGTISYLHHGQQQTKFADMAEKLT